MSGLITTAILFCCFGASSLFSTVFVQGANLKTNGIDGSSSFASDYGTEMDFREKPMDTDNESQPTVEVSTRSPGPRTALIAELVGLTTLKGFALLAFPILIPLFLMALAVLLLPLQIFSTPIAAIGRRLGDHQEIDDVLEEILQTTNCIERLSCEVGRNVKTPQVRSIIDQSFAELGTQLEGKWKNSLKGYILGSNSRLSTKNICSQFKCKIVKNPL